MHAPMLHSLSRPAHEKTRTKSVSSVRPKIRICVEQTWWERSERRVLVSRRCRLRMATALGTTSSSPNDRYAVTSNPFYDVDTEKYSRQISEKANEKKRAAMNGRTANGTSDGRVVDCRRRSWWCRGERWEKVHLSSEDEAKGSVESPSCG